VRSVLGDPELSASLGEAGARESLGFTWDATTSEVRTVYRELVGAAA
jgi:hypothetical protein